MGSGPRSSAERTTVRYAVDEATRDAIEAHLRRADPLFVPPLSQRLDLPRYAAKLRERATSFEAWSGGELVGLVAAYLNRPEGGEGFVTSVSVESAFQGSGIADALMHNCTRRARDRGFERIALEVHASNESALALYRRNGFVSSGASGELLKMTLTL
jgi:ribosomal protein S18 acetylase RimI-like enzyme